MLPPWVQEGGPGPLKERLADRAVRERLRAEIAARGAAYAGAGRLGRRCGWAPSRGRRTRWEGRTLADVMDETGMDAVDAICDLLLAEDLRVNQVTPRAVDGDDAAVLRHPVGHGRHRLDVRRRPSRRPRTYGSYPRILGEFVRESALLSLEEAVRKMTSAPAARLGLADRGRLADGYMADVVIFDPATVRANATYDEPRQFPIGIPYVIVNGDGGGRRRRAHRRAAGPRAPTRHGPRLTARSRPSLEPPSGR